MVVSTQFKTGFIVSTRVTKVEHELALPVESVMVKVTVCVFRIEEQSKVFISIAQVAMAQLSNDAESINEESIEKFPLLLILKSVSEKQSAVGGVVSTTVTMAVAVEIFPLTSATINVTVFAPISLHVNKVLSKAKLAIPQLSVDPSSI